MNARFAAVMLITVGCSSNPTKQKDAAIDVPPDAPYVVFMGEYVDWNSTDAQFCGIMSATLQVHGDATRVDHTPPNGRVMMNVTSDALTRIDITPPTGDSGCLVPTSNYTMPGLTLADPAVIAAGGDISMRNFSVATAMANANNYGPLDPAKGHVFVHVSGTPRLISISAASTIQLQWDGSTWTTGETGVNVFFMNVPVGNTAVMTSGSAVGTGTVPVEAGTITYVTLVLS